MSIETLIDTTKPNVARIYDSWLDGTHNFPADRAAGKQMARALPFVMQALNLNRWFVGHAGRKLSEAGLMNFLDLGAGLPTEGSLHEQVKPTARVLYVDSDQDAVTYAQYILREEYGSPSNIRYIQGKIEEIDPILTAAKTFLDVQQPIGICLIGVTWFITDEALVQVFQRLYDWSTPGSMLAVSAGREDLNDPTHRAAIEGYEQRTGAILRPRPVDHLMGPWQPVDGGFKPFEAFAEAELGTSLVGLDFRGKVGYAGFFQRPS